MLAGPIRPPPTLNWGDITRLLVLEVTRTQLRFAPQPGAGGTPTAAAHPSGNTPSAVWTPSDAASRLADIVSRHPEGAPRLSVMVRAEKPEAIAQALRDAFTQSGMSHHRHVAEAVHAGSLASAAPTLAPAAQPSFDATAMLLMTGQLRTHVETPMGPALMVWHREDAQPETGSPARICAVSVAIDHPQLGPLIAHLSLGAEQLDVRLHCDEGAREEVEHHLAALSHQLAPLPYTTHIRMEGAR